MNDPKRQKAAGTPAGWAGWTVNWHAMTA